MMSEGGKHVLVEITGFPRDVGSWPLRIEFVVREWAARGRKSILMNVGPTRKLLDPNYLNVKGPIDFILKVFQVAMKGYILHTHANGKDLKCIRVALCAQYISFLLGRRSVLTFHAGATQRYFPRTGSFWIDAILWLLFKPPRVIICNSPDVRRRIVEDYGVPERKVHSIAGFCPAYMETGIGKLPADLAGFADQHEPLLVLYAAALNDEFATDLVVDAAYRLRREFPELGLVIAGLKQLPEAHLPLVQKLELGAHVILAGRLPRPEFLALLSRAGLFLRTVMSDGAAASILEAFSLGVPVVAVDNGTRPRGCVVYKQNDLEDMVDMLRYVLNNRNHVISRIVVPYNRDSLQQEVELLLSVV